MQMPRELFAGQIEGISRRHFNPREDTWVGWDVQSRLVVWDQSLDIWTPVVQPEVPFEMTSNSPLSLHPYAIGDEWYCFDLINWTTFEWRGRDWSRLARPQDLRKESQGIHEVRYALQQALEARMSRLGVPTEMKLAHIKKAMLALNEIWDAPLGTPEHTTIWDHLLD